MGLFEQMGLQYGDAPEPEYPSLDEEEGQDAQEDYQEYDGQ